jgi:hypothetical protein
LGFSAELLKLQWKILFFDGTLESSVENARRSAENSNFRWNFAIFCGTFKSSIEDFDFPRNF